jgi:hypothetical protein
MLYGIYLREVGGNLAEDSTSVTVCLPFYFLAPAADRRPLVQAGLRRPVFRQRNNTISNGVMHYSQRTKYLDR